MHEKIRHVKGKPKIQFKYIDKEGNTVDMNSIQKRRVAQREEKYESKLPLSSRLNSPATALSQARTFSDGPGLAMINQLKNSNRAKNTSTPRLNDVSSFYRLTQVSFQRIIL